ncbi:hypothetical protein HN011_003480, partial [Eciton burchellii]
NVTKADTADWFAECEEEERLEREGQKQKQQMAFNDGIDKTISRMRRLSPPKENHQQKYDIQYSQQKSIEASFPQDNYNYHYDNSPYDNNRTPYESMHSLYEKRSEDTTYDRHRSEVDTVRNTDAPMPTENQSFEDKTAQYSEHSQEIFRHVMPSDEYESRSMASFDLQESKVSSRSKIKFVDASLTTLKPFSKLKTTQYSKQHSHKALNEEMFSKSHDKERNNNYHHDNHNSPHGNGKLEGGNIRKLYEKNGIRASLNFNKPKAPSQIQVKYIDAPLPTVNPWFKNKAAHHSEGQPQQKAEEITSAQVRGNSVDNNSPADNNNGNNNGMENEGKEISLNKRDDGVSHDQHEPKAVLANTVKSADVPMPTVTLSSEKKKAQHSQQHLQQASEE